jgi:hypothetical protein
VAQPLQKIGVSFLIKRVFLEKVIVFLLIILFLVHHPVNRDDSHLLAHPMASDFTVA